MDCYNSQRVDPEVGTLEDPDESIMQVQGADPARGNPNSQGADAEMGTLEDPDEDKCPLNMRPQGYHEM